MQQLLVVFISLLCATAGICQMQIDTSHTIEHLVNEVLLGEGVVAGNIRYTGARHAIGTFTDSTRMLSINNGILLTSGSALVSTGPNKFTDMQFVNKTPGYAKLEGIANGRTHDAAILAFDFITSAENLSFDFIFASEEYTEYVGSKFNDVFAFFINGPGLADVNLAVLPKTQVPVTINSINYKKNKKYYVDNPTETYHEAIVYDVRKKATVKNKNYGKAKALPQYNIQYDGFTTLLQAACKVVPGELYRIEIAIADVSDYSLDSGVYLAGHSFKSTGDKIIPITNPFQPMPLPTDTLVAEVPPMPEIPVATVVSTLPATSVEFLFDTYSLTDSATSVLEQYYHILKKYPQAMLEITGHTDSMGTDVYNDMLSQNRALSVARYLKQLGIPEKNIHVSYSGEKRPVASNETTEGRARNRRVELIIQQ
ncbi:OmpA family protein [Rhodocytophaga aerolata]|uniref:OmpA family protein n=1 Tax=Rhodocytophaga aerolata TaxID=455078 RepID=A0ABT8R597_9BACT|nr:OmpA family protein [Rhodocytophaga aerolata]MDO1447272.1 OmpA family protein [Rhodocytophaga aerolata]